jgi:cytochrome c oxidase cbb3-type subunit 3
MAPLYAKFVSLPAEALAKDAQAMAIGERLFANNCAGCHGADARGSKGFPNLADGDWLTGGTHDKIKENITNGRQGVMPPMAAALGTAEDVRNVAQYVLSLSGSTHNAAAAGLGTGQVRRLRGVPRAGRQGQPGPGRAQPDRQDLAARLR